MNNYQQIAPVIVNDSQLETEFTCMIECDQWSIKAQFRFHTPARCVRVTAENGNTQRCVSLRADRSATVSDADESTGFNTAHLLVTDNQIPWAHGLDFQALQHAIAIADWISRFLCLTAEKPAIEAQKTIESMCVELGLRLANGGSLLGPCL
ncbi:MAG: hypothetical protein DCF25_11895 [Leptolyngbya foveolarum]|uniref:Uncharacterized protein n=1 Tax=Leptolyngbya foveolarum TaxID=47253 RepID=A0A2W4UCZ3_9CYAN|nr:MAG: hypothetical protein DCF25_11895 [Leptolyngbya foveolarum]